MTRWDTVLWVLLPYVALTSFVVGHVWRYRRDGFTWTARSTQLLERRLLFVGSIAFHLGMLGVIGGHVLGILVPVSWTDAVGISERAYHWLAVVAGGAAGILLCVGALVLVYRRLKIDRIRATTLRSDWVMYPLLLVTIAFGMLCTFLGGLVDEYHYRETVSPWFRSIFTLDPKGELMLEAPFIYQAHVTIAWLLYA
ncbi:MAG TPA: respiratory nitrate reductase subunit gamma, partial [Gaiella sp.]|nr:respiratory nitrate reductase subunit gamma [Gaiella sp.]